jgi:hypothetical protein
MLRFVILRHETPAGDPRPGHYDLMLEQSGVLWTWVLTRLPAGGETVIAQRLPDHRLAYLDYEGEISGGRGCVSRVESGKYEIIEASPTSLVVRLQGSSRQGVLQLRVRTDGSGDWDVCRTS